MIVLSLFNFVNEVTSRKLPIDRIKVAQKLGALKDVSLFGSFEFPSSGSNSGGLVACSLAGIGKELKKKRQLKSIANHARPTQECDIELFHYFTSQS